MTPAARVGAAIAVLDEILAGAPAERVLTRWGRRNRYAGSGDRAAVRDRVFDALRCRRSFAALGGAETGRGLMIGAVRAEGSEPEAVFTGARYAPAPLTEAERAAGRPHAELTANEALDVPDWIAPQLSESLGAAFPAVMDRLRERAPVFLRTNLLRADRAQAAARLAAEGIATRPHPLSPTALEITEGARKLRASQSFADGLVELQDAASQAVVDSLPLADAPRVLDLCAGGGGKSLALAGRGAQDLTATDAHPGRMRDLPDRARRAGARIAVDADGTRPTGPFDLVLCDVPCSGSGAWRRQPDAKWRLDAAELARLAALQVEILAEAATLTAPRGAIAYVTCSLLAEENAGRVDAFLADRPSWRRERERVFTPLDGGDGFYLSLLRRAEDRV